MGQVFKGYKDIFTKERRRSLLVAFVILGLAVVFQFYASMYSQRVSSNFVHDIILDNLPIVNLNLIIVEGALAAIAVALNFGVDHKTIRKALSGYKPPPMRLEVDTIGGIEILNDSYNSNPLSMARALEAVRCYPAEARWVVSGDMLELGRESERFHKMIGESIARSGIEGLVTFGEMSKHTFSRARALGMRQDRLWHCSTHDEIAGLIRRFVRKGDVVLVKGSRGMGMEKVLEKLREV